METVNRSEERRPKVSVIVPVYNVELYIERCVKSIQAQSFENIEIILVDDGSTDASGIICDTLAETDTRIIVFHHKNAGVSMTRNAGISYAKGEYLLFVDSDDFIERDYVEMLLKNESDFTMCGVRKVDEQNNVLSIVNYPDSYSSIADLDVIKMISCGEIYSPYCKLFRRLIIIKNNIHYSGDVSWGEDGMFVADYIRCVDNIRYISYIGYNYVRYVKENTLSTKVRSDILEMVTRSRTYFKDRMIDLAPSKKTEIETVIDSNIYLNCKFFIRSLLDNPKMSKREKELILDSFRECTCTESILIDLGVYSWGINRANGKRLSSIQIMEIYTKRKRLKICLETLKKIKRRIRTIL